MIKTICAHCGKFGKYKVVIEWEWEILYFFPLKQLIINILKYFP